MKLLQINPVVRTNTSTGRIMREIGQLAMTQGWESYLSYSRGRDGVPECDSSLLPVGDKSSVFWHGIGTRLFDSHGLWSTSATKKFIKDIERLAPDIIHIHNIHGYFLNYEIFFEYLRSSGIPVIWTVHDCWLYTGHCYYYTFAGCDKWKSGCGGCPQRDKFPRSLLIDRSAQSYKRKQKAFTSLKEGQLTIVPVSDWIRQEMSESFLKDCRFKVIHNGIDTQAFKPAPKQRWTQVAKKYSLTGNKVVVGVASIWTREKGMEDFIQLSKILPKDTRIVLVGLTEQQQRELPENIVGIRRTSNLEELADLYSLASVFANPTWQDNYPTVNLESISCGTPVVTYRTGGSVEAITPNTGVIVERGDVRAMAQAINQIIRNGKEAYENNCRQYALENFRKEDRYQEYMNLYEDLLRERHP